MDNRPAEPTSLEKKWGTDKQEQWKQMRASSIAKAVVMCKEDRPNFSALYEFLTNERINIAKALSPGVADEIATARRTDSRAGLEDAYQTNIADRETYQDFLPSLLQTFNEQTKHHKTEKAKGRSSFVYSLQDGVKVNATETLAIQHNKTSYSTLTKLDITDLDGQKKTWININHTSGQNIPIIMDKVGKLYESLANIKNDAEKIEVIKEIGWHLAHAMPRKRGSAAICEMVMETLLEVHGIKYNAPKPPITMDLIAIFSATQKDFSRRIVLNVDIELKATLNSFLQKNKGLLSKVNLFNHVDSDMLNAAKKLVQKMEKKEVDFNENEMKALRSPVMQKYLPIILQQKCLQM